MPRLPERQARQEFRRISQAEAKRPSLRYGIELKEQDLALAIAEATRDFPQIAKNLPARVSIRLGNEIKGGRSAWRVRTGKSRSRFKGDARGIINDVSYANFLEGYQDEEPARRYAEGNVERVAADVVKRAVAKE